MKEVSEGEVHGISPVFFVYWRGHTYRMIGVKQNTKRFSLGTFFFVFFLAFVTQIFFDSYIHNKAYAQAPPPSLSETKAAATPPAGTPAKTANDSSNPEKGDSCWISPMCVAKGLLYGILTFCAFLAMIAATIFSYVLDVSHLKSIMDNVVIYEMWRIVRDFFNLFFIFSLLLVAFSTIFQVSKYGGLKSIWNIVLAALFINFSFPIARMIIDVGNVMMYSFINDIFGMTAGSLNSGILSTSGLRGLFFSKGFDSSAEFKFYFIAIVCMFMFGVSFLTLALMMFYRLFMLPILVMFSPIGFAGSAIPGMGGYASQWWDKLIKNVFFGPIAVFMMMIAVKFLGTLTASNIAKNSTIGQDTIISAATSGDLLASIVYMTIPIIFFWIAITSAEKLSSDASGMANSFGSKFLKWSGGLPWRGTKELAKFGGRKIESKLASMGGKWKYLSPTVVTGAWKARSETQKHEDMLPIEMAQAQVQNQLNEGISKIPGINKITHKERTDHEFMMQNKQKARYEAEIKERSGGQPNEDQIRAFLREGYQEKNTAKILAATTLLSRDNGLDNIAGDFAAELGTAVEGSMGEGSIDIVKSYKGTMEKMLRDLGMDDQSIKKHMHNFGENAKSKGDDAFGDLFRPDLIKGKWEDNPDHAGTVAGNFIKMKAQTRQDVQHARSLFAQSQKGDKREYSDLHESGFAKAMKLNADDVKNVNRKNGVVDEAIVAAVKGATDNPKKYEKFITAYNANPNFKNYVNETMGKKGGYEFKKSSAGDSQSGSGADGYAAGVKPEDLKIV